MIRIIKKAMKEITKQIIELLFPRRCALCDDVLPVVGADWKGSYICQKCKKNLQVVKEPVCKKCGKPLENERAEYCMDCGRKKHAYTQGKAVFVYQGAIQSSLYRFKYLNRREYADFYADWAVMRYEKWRRQKNVQLIVPVPLHKNRQKKRGYNQAELFARALGTRLNIPVCTNLLVRERNTVPQKELNDTERKNNLKNAFKITQNIVQLSCILLVDDIYTTGSTMDAIATVLKRAGYRDIYFICASIGKGF